MHLNSKTNFKNIWNYFISQGSNLQQSEVHVVLFLLILKKYGFTLNPELKGSPSLLIKSFLANDTISFDERIIDVAGFYENIVDNLEFDFLLKSLSILDNESSDSIADDFLAFFDYLLSQILITAGKYSGEFILPAEISNLMLSLAKVNEKSKIYNPFAGASTFAINNIDYTYLGQEINLEIKVIALMRLIASDSSSKKQMILGDSISNWNPTNDEFDIVIASPPFNMDLPKEVNSVYGRIKKVESFFIKNALETTVYNGKVIIIVPEGYLSALGTTGNLRNYLIESDLVEMVISLPNGIFINTGIKTSILVLNKSKEQKGLVQFVNAAEFVRSEGRFKRLNETDLMEAIQLNTPENLVTVTNQNIVNSGGYLNVGRYFLETINGIKLGEILEVVNGSRINEEFEAKIVQIKDINSTTLDISELEIRKDYNRTFFRIIDESCLLLAPSSTYLKAAWFDYTGVPILIKHNIKAFRIKSDNVDVNYLANQFKEGYLIKQIEAFSMGSIVPMINATDIFNLEIYLPSLLQQKEWLNKNFLKFIDFEKNKVELIRKQFNEELGSKQHNIRQHLKNVKDSFDVLSQFMKNNSGVLNSTDIINPNRGITVEKRFESLNKSLQNVITEVNNLTNEKNFSQAETFDLVQLVEESIEEHTTSNYEIELQVDSLGLEQATEDKFNIHFSKNDLKELLNNVIENAVKHGFRDVQKKYKIIIYIGFEESKIKLQILNNGIPFPKDVTRSFGIKGMKAGDTANKGIGVWRIIQTINHFGQEYKVVDMPDDEFATGWIFMFNFLN